MKFVFDSSALLASLLGERGKERVDALIGDALMSTVNLAEVVSYFSKQGLTTAEIDAILANVLITYVAPDAETAVAAGNLRARTEKAGLSLGDRFCFALAAQKGAVAVTSDKIWAKIGREVSVDVELIR